MGELPPNQTIRSPLDPYPSIGMQEYNKLTAAEREHQRVHNASLEDVGIKLSKMGWSRGRFTKTNAKPTQKKGETDSDKDRARSSATNKRDDSNKDRARNPATDKRDREKEKGKARVLLLDNESESDADIVLATNTTELVEIESDVPPHLLSDGDSSSTDELFRRNSRASAITSIELVDIDSDVPPHLLSDGDSSSDDELYWHNSRAANHYIPSPSASGEETSDDGQSATVSDSDLGGSIPGLVHLDSDSESDEECDNEVDAVYCLSFTCADLVEIMQDDPAITLKVDS
jgi:hypothetical protein